MGRYLLQRGDDVPGNLLLGEAAAKRVNQQLLSPISDRDKEYPNLALRALGRDPVGSSAAGEQPKFAVYHGEAGHVIVKFSSAASTDEAQRWRDLLRAEHHALLFLREQAVPTAATTLHSIDGRIFLESQRFDRCGARGRASALSLRMVDAEYMGQGQGWAATATSLYQKKLLDEESWTHIVWSELFGTWIGNTDMHLGNISLSPQEQGFRLLPLYDMLPMSLAPLHGEPPVAEFRPPIRLANQAQAWVSAGKAAAEYWQRLADDAKLSESFRSLANQRRQDLLHALGRS
jgi:hypothetical protein